MAILCVQAEADFLPAEVAVGVVSEAEAAALLVSEWSFVGYDCDLEASFPMFLSPVGNYWIVGLN